MLARVTKLMQRSSEQGLTLVECLMAVVVITAVIAAIAPPILLAAATRVQNQRVGQANELARGEIDRIRLLIEQGQYLTANLPPVSTQTPIRNTAALASGVAGYTSSRANITTTKGLAVDINGGNPDFVIQTFREDGRKVNNIPIAFWMGVRVYSYQAFVSNATLQSEPLRLSFTSGQNLQRPLAVLYTPIVRSDRDFSLCEYRKFLNSSASCP